MIGAGGTGWTETRIEVLIKLYADGLSASQIATELGGISRNAVIGKVHRLGLVRKLPTRSSYAKPKPKPERTARIWLPRKIEARSALPDHLKPEAFVARETDVVPLHIDLLELSETTCKFPFGTSNPYTFCGHPPAEGEPYCAAHCRIAYQPPAARNRAPRPREHVNF